MNLFIDTNIFLSFYYLSSDDLEELNKLAVLLQQSEVTLFLTNQVVEEFWRNRENKIGDALKKLKDQRLNLQFPQLCKDYREYRSLRDLQKGYEDKHAELLKKLHSDIESHTLRADVTILKLFKAGTLVQTSAELIQAAQARMQTGNPPGKDGSLGDAISWEALLLNVPKGEPLYLVSDDCDFRSTLDETRLKEFLLREWTEKKASEITYYVRLSSFFNDHFPKIRLAREFEKELLIRKLAGSKNFASAHNLIAQLSNFTDFTSAQATNIVDAALSNPQVTWIIEDEDVNEFLRNVIGGRERQIDSDRLKSIQSLLSKSDSRELSKEDDIPF